jgi:integrase
MHYNLKVWTAAAGIAPCSANDFRRSYATLLAERGEPENLTARYLGHGSSKMVRAVYQQVTDRMRGDTIKRFGSVLNSCSESVTPIEKGWEYRPPGKAGGA